MLCIIMGKGYQEKKTRYKKGSSMAKMIKRRQKQRKEGRVLGLRKRVMTLGD